MKRKKQADEQPCDHHGGVWSLADPLIGQWSVWPVDGDFEFIRSEAQRFGPTPLSSFVMTGGGGFRVFLLGVN